MIKGIIDKIKKSNRIKNVAKISSGTLAGQVISIITVPIFTRLYGPETLGIWAFLNAIFLFVNSFSDAGLTLAIMPGKDKKMRERIYKVVTTMVMLFSIIVSIGLILFYVFIKQNDTRINLIFLFFYSIIAIFTLQQTQVCYTWLNKEAKYDVLMKNPLINNLIFGIIGVILGVLGFKQYGYFIGWIIGQIITLLHMKKYLPKIFFTFNIDDYKSVFKENIEFIRYQLPANIINVFKNQLPTFLIKSFFGTTILGYYSISVKILNIPITLLGSAVGRVFFQESSKMVSEGKNIGEFTYRSMYSMMKVGVVPMILLVSLGKFVITMLLGKDWGTAGDMLVIISFQTYFIFLTASVQGVSINLNKQNYVMIMYIAQVIEIIIAFLIGKYLFDNIFISLIIMSVLFIIINISYFCAIFKVMGVSRKKYLKDILSNFAIIFAISIALIYCINRIGVCF